MKIKTINKRLDQADEFDAQVNAATAEGWRLVKREVIPAGPNPDSHRLLYAELVEPDPVPEAPEAAEPQPADPFDAVRAIKATCMATPMEDCQHGRCPLYAWCCQQESCTDPSEWEVPEKKDAPA